MKFDLKKTVRGLVTAGHDAAYRRSSIERDHRSLLPALFPDAFPYRFAPHQDELWEWVWGIKAGAGSNSFVALWPRGSGKSTTAEAAVVVVAARKSRHYGLYISATQDQADKHVSAIETKLGSAGVRSIYPYLGTPRVNVIGHTKGWRRNELAMPDFTVQSLGLDAASRGAKDDDFRPDFYVIDDIDGRHDSIHEAKRKMEVLADTVLMGMAGHACVLFVQNLIHSDSVASHIAEGRTGLLADAVISGPYPALLDMEYEEVMARDVRGVLRRRTVITGGTPTWEGQDRAACQQLVDKVTINAFLREAQQDVRRPLAGALFPMFDELYSVITWSEFQRVFQRPATDSHGQPRLPLTGNVAMAQDVGGTIEHPNASVWVWRPDAGTLFNDSVFVYRELVLPEWPDPVTESVSPLSVGEKIVRLEMPWNEGSRIRRWISHEANTEAAAYRKDLPKVRIDDLGYLPRLNFVPWNARRRDGVGILQSYMTIIDKSQPNPFRPSLMGRTRLYLVVDDEQGGVDRVTGVRRNGWDARGLVRLRAELPQYTEEKTHGGGPAKVFDDATDALKRLSEQFFASLANVSEEDEIWAQVPEQFRPDARPEVLAALNEVEHAALPSASYYAYHEAKSNLDRDKKDKSSGQGYFERLRKYQR
jgi:hypothetical protein